MHTLYVITNLTNNKQYFGATKDPVRREREHMRGGNASLVAAAISKYGAQNFTFKTLVIGSKEYISDLETKAITAFNTLVPNGYNKAKGGFPSGPVKYGNNPRRTGKTNGERQRKAVGEYMRNRVITAETRQRMADARRGQKHTAETKAKMSQARIGNRHALGKRWNLTDEQRLVWREQCRKAWQKRKAHSTN